MASRIRRESTDYVTHLARPLRRGSAPVTSEYDLNNGRRMKLTYGQPIQTRNLKLYELGDDFIPRFFEGKSYQEVDDFVLYLLDNLELVCGNTNMRIKAELIKYFNDLDKGGLKIYILYNEDKLSKKRRVQDNIKAFAIVSEHLTRLYAHEISYESDISEDSPTELSGDINCFKDGYSLDNNENFKPYLFVHYLCGMAPMIMPDIESSIRRIERENRSAPVTSYLQKTFRSKKFWDERRKRVRLLTKKQKDDIKKLPRDELFKGVGKELLDKLAVKYKKKGTLDFIYLDAVEEEKTLKFYKSCGYKYLYSEKRDIIYKSFHDTSSMIKVLYPDECDKSRRSSTRSKSRRSSSSRSRSARSSSTRRSNSTRSKSRRNNSNSRNSSTRSASRRDGASRNN